jgi:hypothetical protein
MIIKPEKIMPLAVTCHEFCSLAYGLIDKLDFYSSYSKNKSYESYFDELDLLQSSPLMVKAGLIPKLSYIKSLTKALIEEIRFNPEFNSDLQEHKTAFVLEKKKSHLSFKIKTLEDKTTFEYTSGYLTSYTLDDKTNEHILDLENSKWPFFKLLNLCLTELNIDYQSLEGWLVDFINNHFEKVSYSETPSKQSSAMKNKKKEIQNPESLDKALVALSILLSQRASLFESGGKPNFSKIQDAVITQLQSLDKVNGQDNKYGLSKLEKHISQAYQALTSKKQT